mmetsp:Transcript_113658/g.361063  ORF Transcript_113658/g.361063 Transcript_113658/m.361063 type:complete len:260 (-) Transcript_113658:919-1698(-)
MAQRRSARLSTTLVSHNAQAQLKVSHRAPSGMPPPSPLRRSGCGGVTVQRGGRPSSTTPGGGRTAERPTNTGCSGAGALPSSNHNRPGDGDAALVPTVVDSEWLTALPPITGEAGRLPGEPPFDGSTGEPLVPGNPGTAAEEGAVVDSATEGAAVVSTPAVGGGEEPQYEGQGTSGASDEGASDTSSRLEQPRSTIAAAGSNAHALSGEPAAPLWAPQAAQGKVATSATASSKKSRPLSGDGVGLAMACRADIHPEAGK